MNTLLFAVLGLGAGAVIAGLAVSVVVAYRGSGIINLAIGGYAMIAAYAFWAFKHGFFNFTLSTSRRSSGPSPPQSASGSCRSYSCSDRCARHLRWPSSLRHSASC